MTHNQQILAHLKEGQTITPVEALSLFGCFRLGARIYDLKQDGHQIEKDMIETPGGARVARYRLA